MEQEIKPTIIVSGLARCGTSLTMQMLHACGIKCAGEPPAFEPDETNVLRGLSADWIRRFEAVKILDPHRAVRFPRINALILWLDRDPKQQATSQLKMAAILAGMYVGREARGRMMKGLRKDRGLALRQFAGMPMLQLAFEDLIGNPLASAALIRDFVAPHFVLNAEMMVSCVRPRANGAMCEPGLDMELALVEDHRVPR